jgi:hypothetical protein
VRLARPGATGFTAADESHARGAGRAQGLAHPDKGLAIGDVLANEDEPLARRLEDVAEIITWRALNTGPEDVEKLRALPKELWRQRHRLQSRLVSMGMQWMTRPRRRRGARRAASQHE